MRRIESGSTPYFVILSLLATILLSGCAQRQSAPGAAPAPPAAAAAAKPIVVTSILPLTDWVKQIAGDAVEAYTLLPAGASPHTYEPTPDAAEHAAAAKLLVVNGLGLDDWARKLASNPQTRTLVLGDLVQTMTQTFPDEPSEVGAADPHVFLDPVRAAQMLPALTDALIALAPAQAVQMRERSAAYQLQLQQFATKLAEACKPYAGRHTVTFHNAYQYFLLRCGLPIAEVVEEFPGKEPSAEYLEKLGAKTRQEHLKVVYAEPQFSTKAADVLAQAIGGQVLMLDEVGNPDDPSRDSYLKLLQFDLDEIVKGMQVK
jgi:zinc transport system substrate-binding protein